MFAIEFTKVLAANTESFTMLLLIFFLTVLEYQMKHDMYGCRCTLFAQKLKNHRPFWEFAILTQLLAPVKNKLNKQYAIIFSTYESRMYLHY